MWCGERLILHAPAAKETGIRDRRQERRQTMATRLAKGARRSGLWFPKARAVDIAVVVARDASVAERAQRIVRSDGGPDPATGDGLTSPPPLCCRLLTRGS